MDFKGKTCRDVLIKLHTICENEAYGRWDGDYPDELASAMHWAEKALSAYDRGAIKEADLYDAIGAVVISMIQYCFEYNRTIDALFGRDNAE